MTIIKAENLGKKYIIGHNRKAEGSFRYNSMRESISQSFRSLYQQIRHPLSPNIETTELEEFWALKNINFEINQGDRVGIIGQNGAGKTTLLKLLSRITEPSTGSIKIKGRIASLLEVGTGFHPELTGRENIYLNGAILGMKRVEIKRKFDEIVAFAEVEKFLDTPVKRYSSGMYVRLAFAVAAHLDPEILLIDEVLAVGDAAFQKKSLSKMEEVSRDGRTILFVSHNMASIKSLCNNGIFLQKGKIFTLGKIEKIITTYLKETSSDKEILKNVFDKKNNCVKSICINTIDKRNYFFCNDPLKIQVKIVLEKDMKNLDLNIAFWDKDIKLFMFFASKLVKHGYNQEEPFKKGENIISFEIPEGILNEGRYYVNFALHTNFKDFLHIERNALIFDIVDSSDFMDKYRTSFSSKININAKNILFEHRCI